MQGNSISVERIIEAPGRQIFALIADAGKHPSFDGSGTVDHSALSSQPLTLGSRFGMSMRARPESSPCPSGGRYPHGLIGGRIWRYELEPVARAEASATSGTGGTLVRETWDVSADRQRPMLKMGSTPREAEDGMRATLERIAALLKP
ncbi:MAG: SRPBCC family protein [Mycobacterium sp.]